jgi:hypothetical protein
MDRLCQGGTLGYERERQRRYFGVKSSPIFRMNFIRSKAYKDYTNLA